MRLGVFVALALLAWPAARAGAGEWSCGGQELHLDRRPAAREPATPATRAWAASVRKAGAVDLFVPSRATVSTGGGAAQCRLYQAADAEPDTFLVLCEANVFYVDFARKEILSLGTSLSSLQEASDRSSTMVVHAAGTRVGGVPVGALCLSSPYWNPWFREREVWWR